MRIAAIPFVALLYYLPYRGLYKCFQSESKYPFRKVDLWAIEKGLMFGFYDAVGKSGWYVILKKVFSEERKEELKTLSPVLKRNRVLLDVFYEEYV